MRGSTKVVVVASVLALPIGLYNAGIVGARVLAHTFALQHALNVVAALVCMWSFGHSCFYAGRTRELELEIDRVRAQLAALELQETWPAAHNGGTPAAPREEQP